MLDERGQALLAFERHWQENPVAKENAIRQTFHFSPTRYYQLLGKVIFTAEALEFDPELVTRLQRLHRSRRDAREARMRGTHKK